VSETVRSNVSNETIQEWMREYETQKRVCDVEQGVLRNIRKRAKADGVNLAALTAVSRARKMDPQEAVAELRDTTRYYALRNIPVSRETLFDGWTPRVTEKARELDDVWDAEDAGFQAGRHGTDIAECPYEIGSMLHAEWLSWWHKGQESRSKELGPDATQAPATRRRPRQTRFPGMPRAARQEAQDGPEADGRADGQEAATEAPRKAQGGRRKAARGTRRPTAARRSRNVQGDRTEASAGPAE